MAETLLVRDVMHIGVPTCKQDALAQAVAVQMLEQNCTAIIVMDDEGDSRGWIGERQLAASFPARAANPTGAATDASLSSNLTAADIMDEDIPESPADIPLTAAVQIMADMAVDHLFYLHRAGGQAWPSAVLELRDVVRALAGPEYIRNQGTGAPAAHAEGSVPSTLRFEEGLAGGINDGLIMDQKVTYKTQRVVSEE